MNNRWKWISSHRFPWLTDSSSALPCVSFVWTSFKGPRNSHTVQSPVRIDYVVLLHYPGRDIRSSVRTTKWQLSEHSPSKAFPAVAITLTSDTTNRNTTGEDKLYDIHLFLFLIHSSPRCSRDNAIRMKWTNNTTCLYCMRKRSFETLYIYVIFVKASAVCCKKLIS